MEEVTTGAIAMTWEPGSRLAGIRFGRDTHATGVLSGWIGNEHQPFGLLGDGGRERIFEPSSRPR